MALDLGDMAQDPAAMAQPHSVHFAETKEAKSGAEAQEESVEDGGEERAKKLQAQKNTLPDGVSYNEINDELVQRVVLCERKLEALKADLFVHREYDSVFDALISMKTDWLMAYKEKLTKAKDTLSRIMKKDLEELNSGIHPDSAVKKFHEEEGEGEDEDEDEEDVEEVPCAGQELQVKAAQLEELAFGLQEKIQEVETFLEEVFKCRDPSRPFTLFVATWNIGNRAPSLNDLKAVIEPQGEPQQADIIVFGTQESNYKMTAEMREQSGKGYQTKRGDKIALRKLHTSKTGGKDVSVDEHFASRSHKHRLKVENNIKKTVYLNKTTETSGNHVLFMLSEILGSDYFLVREAELNEMRLYILVRKAHVAYITDVVYSTESTGVAGILANKGGVGISLVVDGLKLCFISCHLAAHKRYVAQRTSNLLQIFQSLKKRLGNRGFELHSEFDHIFVLGDMNYRLDLNRSDNDAAQVPPPSDLQFRDEEDPKADASKDEWNSVMNLVSAKKWGDIRAADQLVREMKRGKILAGFVEGQYDFLPTFKVEREKVEPSYLENRTPSYCDRILWYSLPSRAKSIQQNYLSSCVKAVSSDHKPICSFFTLARNSVAPVLQIGALSTSRKSEKKHSRNPLISRIKLLNRRSFSDVGEKGLQIRICNLEVHDIRAADYDGKSDPYVVFCSPVLFPQRSPGASPMKGVAQTPVQKRRLHAAWRDNQVPCFHCHKTLNTADSLKGRYMVLAVWDHDVISRDDPLGQAVLDLNAALESFERAVTPQTAEEDAIGGLQPFELPIIFDTQSCGTISGEIQILGSRVRLRRFRSQKSSVRTVLNSVCGIPCGSSQHRKARKHRK